jgi:nucleoid-associated protein YgaU
MTRPQIVALSLGTAVLAVAAGIAWHVHLMQAQADHPLAAASVASPSPSAVPSVVPPAPQPPSSVPPSSSASVSPPAAAVPPSDAPPPPKAAYADHIPPEETIAPPAIDLVPTLPQFDTVRVEPSGDAVIAGHGQADAQVALLANGNPVAETDSDGAGNFVIIPTPFAPGNYELSLRSQRAGKPARLSEQVVTVSVPAKGKKNLVVAVAEPGKPTQVLADTAAPPAVATPAPPSAPVAAAAAPSVAFKTSEVDKDGLYATGTATPPGEHLRMYLNDAHIADLSAATDGHWSLTVKRGLTPGHYTLRADALDAVLTKVVARAEVNFDVPVLVAAAEPKAPAIAPAATDAAPASSAPSVPPPSSSSASSSTAAMPSAPDAPATAPSQQANSETPAPASTTTDAVVPSVNTATVIHGDSLWRISRKIFGQGIRYTLIYEANATQIRNPDLIYPGQVFVVPANK